MGRSKASRYFSNEGSMLVEVLGRYLERRRRDRSAKGKTIESPTRPRKVADKSPA